MKAKKYIGIDVSKKQLDIYVRPTALSWNVGNNEAEIAELVKKLKELEPTLIILEATGGLEKNVFQAARKEQLPIVIVNPRQARDFARATGRLAKTDAIDAEVLAHFGEAVKPKPGVVRAQEEDELKSLNTRRRELVKILTAEKNRYHSAPVSLKNDIDEHIKWLQKKIKDMDDKIEKQVKSNENWKNKDEIIQSVKGLGPVVSHTMIAALPELGKINNNKIAALIGVAPFNCDSGKWKGRRIIWGGRAEIRSVLYMGTLRATTCNPVIKNFYNRLINAGKAPKVAITACMRKLVVILNSMIKNNTQWQPAEV